MLHDYINQLVESNYSDGLGEHTNSDIAQMTYSVAESLGANFDAPSDSDIELAELAFSGVCDLLLADDSQLELMEQVYSAEDELGIEFTVDGLQVIQDCYNAELDQQDCFSEGYDPAEAAIQTAYSSGLFFQGKDDSKMIKHYTLSALENLGLYKERSKWQKFKDSFAVHRPSWVPKLHHRPVTRTGRAVVTATNIIGSPVGQLVMGALVNKAAKSKLGVDLMQRGANQSLHSAINDLEESVFTEALYRNPFGKHTYHDGTYTTWRDRHGKTASRVAMAGGALALAHYAHPHAAAAATAVAKASEEAAKHAAGHTTTAADGIHNLGQHWDALNHMAHEGLSHAGNAITEHGPEAALILGGLAGARWLGKKAWSKFKEMRRAKKFRENIHDFEDYDKERHHKRVAVGTGIGAAGGGIAGAIYAHHTAKKKGLMKGTSEYRKHMLTHMGAGIAGGAAVGGLTGHLTHKDQRAELGHAYIKGGKDYLPGHFDQAKYSALDELEESLFSGSEEDTCITNMEAAERAHEETTGDAPISVDVVAALEDRALPTNTIVEALPAYDLKDSTIYDSDLWMDEVAKRDMAIENHFTAELEDAAFPQETYSLASRIKSIFKSSPAPASQPQSSSYDPNRDKYNEARGKAYFDYGDHDNIRVGTLGSGSDFQRRLAATYGHIGGVYDSKSGTWSGNGAPGFTGSKFFSKDAPSFWKVMRNSALDAVAEGMITGAYYQSLDTGLNVAAGTVRRTYQGAHSIMTPVFDNLQKKLEQAGSQFANWILPDGPSATDIISEMTDQDAMEIIKTLDSASWLTKLPEAARNRFLMNLSKSGCCYIDEKGTLKKRSLIDSLIKTYEEDPDRFMEILPQTLKEIEELYKVTALISHDSINTESIYNRLKTATAVDQIRSILEDEFNIIKKPLVSLKDLTISLSNDFITLMKSDKTYFRSLVNKISASIAYQVRDKGASEITQMADAFLKRLHFADTEVEIRRATEVLVVANVKHLENELGAASNSTSTFSEEDPGEATIINVPGNVNMENSPVKALGTRSMLEPANLGRNAGWTDADMLRGEHDDSRDPLQNAKDATNTAAAITNPISISTFSEGSSDFYSPESDITTCSPGFGMYAL